VNRIQNTARKWFKPPFERLRIALTSHALQRLRLLKRWQWLDESRSMDLQKKRLRKMLRHAFDHVPYYRKTLKQAGVVDDSGRVDLELFSKIPLLDKDTIRSYFENLKSDDLFTRKWHLNYSGGSTGKPVNIIQDFAYSDWMRAAKILYDEWTGCSIASPRILLWGSLSDLGEGNETLKARLMHWLNNEIRLNAFHLTPVEMSVFAKKINAFQPVQILAYAESIYEMSRFIKNERLKVYSPRSIMSTAGTLFPYMRETVEQVFKTRIFNRYGSREMGDVACECDRHEGLHVCMPNHFVEIIREDGEPAVKGETGEIVVTCLTNYAMPFIRYRIGDMGSWSERSCSCGRGWPILSEVTGRTSDIFLTKKGDWIHGTYFTTLFFNSHWVKKFQVIQESHEHVRILLVVDGSVRNPRQVFLRELDAITMKVQTVMGRGCKVEYEFTDDISPTASGKYRFTISKIAQ